MPATRDYEKLLMPKFVADEASVDRLGGGAQIDWANIVADADGIKKVLAGEVLSRDSAGLVQPRDLTTAVVTISVTAGVATVTHTGHPYAVGDQIRISGATPAELNGVQTITNVVDPNTYEFATTAADGAATGTINATAKAFGLAIATTDDGLGNNKGMIGVYVGGVFYGNLLATTLDADIEAELGNRFFFQTYADSRLV